MVVQAILERERSLLETPTSSENTAFDREFAEGKLLEFGIALSFAVAFPLFRWILDRTVYESYGLRALGLPSRADASKEQLATLTKFKESAYKCGVQIFMTVTVFSTLAANPEWVRDTRLLWSECYQLPCLAPISWLERLVYGVSLGFYTQALPMLFLWETRRHDWLETGAHHVATIALIGYSYYLNLTRVGVLVLACHESNDIFMEMAKMARYAERKRTTSVLLTIFVISWFATRVFAFPIFVIRSTLFECRYYGKTYNVNIEPHYTILNGFLIFLLCLHIYWSYLILRIAFRQAKHGDAEDIREKDE